MAAAGVGQRLVRHADGRVALLGAPVFRLLAAAALCGGALLGLEVLWFRFLQLFAFGTSAVFAVMLTVVLLGIALGGLAGGEWLRARPDAVRLASVLALAATVFAHAGAALKHHFINRDDVLTRMLPLLQRRG